jgi:hypothetical protein
LGPRPSCLKETTPVSQITVRVGDEERVERVDLLHEQEGKLGILLRHLHVGVVHFDVFEKEVV